MNTVEKYRRYVTTSALAAVEPITVESARGATVTATDGTEYTDLYSGIGVVNAGHVPPKVAEAAKRQMDKVVHSCSYVYHVPVVADLAERLAQVTPGRLQKTFFGNSGAEAVEGALRLARVFTGRREIIALQGSFHGRTAGALAVTGNALRKHGGGGQVAVEASGVEPDIMTMAKGIASGFPLGAFIAREDVADAFEPGDHMSTFGGNPISCAAGVATIDMLVDERLPERAARIGATVMARLDAFAVESDLVGDVRGSGLMIGIELVRDRVTKEPASTEAAAVKRHCRERGVLIGVGGSLGNVVRVQPPLVIGEEELDRAIGVIEEAVTSLAAQPVG